MKYNVSTENMTVLFRGNVSHHGSVEECLKYMCIDKNDNKCYFYYHGAFVLTVDT